MTTKLTFLPRIFKTNFFIAYRIVPPLQEPSILDSIVLCSINHERLISAAERKESILRHQSKGTYWNDLNLNHKHLEN